VGPLHRSRHRDAMTRISLGVQTMVVGEFMWDPPHLGGQFPGVHCRADWGSSRIVKPRSRCFHSNECFSVECTVVVPICSTNWCLARDRLVLLLALTFSTLLSTCHFLTKYVARCRHRWDIFSERGKIDKYGDKVSTTRPHTTVL